MIPDRDRERAVSNENDSGMNPSDEGGDLVVLKLGGSVITDKQRPETVDTATLESTAAAIGRRLEIGVDQLVVIHGGGSFGHHHASNHEVTTESGTPNHGAVMDIHGAMTTLNQRVISRLHDEGVPALPIHPLSVAARECGGGLSLPTTAVEGMLREGFVPVMHGDGVVHAGEGVTVLSGDEIVVSIAEQLRADRVGVCSTVSGVLDGQEVIPQIASFDAVTDVFTESETTDVSGGMAGKVRQLLALDAPAHVFGPDQLDAFLRGEDPGTRVD